MSKKELVFNFIHDISMTSSGDTKITTTDIAEQLNMQRSNVSSILNQLVNERKIEKIDGRPVIYKLVSKNINNNQQLLFKKLIGFDHSIKKQINLAMASIMYPGENMNTIICGQCGCGKKAFVDAIIDYAVQKKVIKDISVIKKVDCKLCADTIEKTLESYLNNKSAEMVILYNIDQITKSCQVKVQSILNNVKDKKVHIICTFDDENIDKDLINFFPVVINLPSLEEKGLEERLCLIERFFESEAGKINRKIIMNAEVVHCLLLYKCKLNIFQLKKDIKVSCANAYMREMDSDGSVIYIHLNDLPEYVKQGFLLYKENKENLETIVSGNYTYSFLPEHMEKEKRYDKVNNINQTIYSLIDNKITEYRKQGFSNEELNESINREIEYDLSSLIDSYKKINKESLSKIVDVKIINMVQRFIEGATIKFKTIYPQSLIYGLSLHLSEAFLKAGKIQKLSNEKIYEIMTEHRQEYAYSMEFVADIEKVFHVRLSVDEVVLITMFLCNENKDFDKTKHPNLLIAMHGDGGATSVAKVVNTLNQCSNVYAFNLNLDEKIENIYERFKTYIQEIDNGLGILMIYDMGSLKNMAEMVTKETGILIRTIETPITLIALDCARKLSVVSNLDCAMDDIMES